MAKPVWFLTGFCRSYSTQKSTLKKRGTLLRRHAREAGTTRLQIFACTPSRSLVVLDWYNRNSF